MIKVHLNSQRLNWSGKHKACTYVYIYFLILINSGSFIDWHCPSTCTYYRSLPLATQFCSYSAYDVFSTSVTMSYFHLPPQFTGCLWLVGYRRHCLHHGFWLLTHRTSQAILLDSFWYYLWVQGALCVHLKHSTIMTLQMRSNASKLSKYLYNNFDILALPLIQPNELAQFPFAFIIEYIHYFYPFT